MPGPPRLTASRPRRATPLAATAVAAITLGLAPALAAADRPAALAMGVTGTVAENAGYGSALGLPISIDAGTQLTGELWWHASAGFGVSTAREHDDDASGYTFALNTGPRVQHCPSPRWCLGASLELGWGHETWDLSWRDSPLSFDDLHLEGRVRAALALSDDGRVLLEASAGPRVRYYLRTQDTNGDIAHDAPLNRSGVLGLALIVRN